MSALSLSQIVQASYGGDEASEEWERQQAERNLAELRQESGLAGALLDAEFPRNLAGADLPTGYAEAARRLEKFAQNWQAVKAGGYGAYVWGDIGTGKTFLAACLANALMTQGVRVKFTSMARIAQEVKATYENTANGNEQSLMRRLLLKPLLIIDDFGTESLARNAGDNFLQDKIFELMDGRLTNGMPTVFTSNYDLGTLLQRRMMEKTIDRVFALTAGGMMEIRGKSFRQGQGSRKPAKMPF